MERQPTTRYQILTQDGDVHDTVFRGATREDAEAALETWSRCGYDVSEWSIVEAVIEDDRTGW